MDNKEKKYEEVKEMKIKPIAYIDDLSGVKVIIEINRDEKKSYTMVIPPSYEMGDEYDDSLPISAVTGHYFTPYEGESYPYEEYKEKLNLLAEKLSKDSN